LKALEFQSTLPSRGATRRSSSACWLCWQFQSTLPSRGATLQSETYGGKLTISIHAPLAGSDAIILVTYKTPKGFQSTLPSRGATNVTL